MNQPRDVNPPAPRLRWTVVVHRLAVCLLCGAAGAFLSALIPVQGVLERSVLFTFATGALACAIPVRIFEHARLADFGLGWESTSPRSLLAGLACGAGAAASVLILMLAFNWVSFEKVPADSPGAGILASVLLLIGASGEEMMFHGYAFLVLVRSLGPFATIVPVGMIFGLAHLSNQNSTGLAVVNTVVWGVLLGYACYASRGLWMPIGMHFGWNLVLPLAGANLSGFTIHVTGYALHENTGGLLTGGAYGPEGSVLTTLAAAALFWAVGRLVPEGGNGDDHS